MSRDYFIKGHKAALRSIEEDDFSLIHRWANDQKTTHYMFTGQIPLAATQTKKAYSREFNSASNVVFIIVDMQTNNPIGMVGLYDLHFTARKAEFRILIGDPDSRGKGIGTEVTTLIVKYGFERLNLHRIFLGVTDENKAAAKTYKKCGFKEEGTLQDDIYRNGRYYDTIRMALVRGKSK